MDFTASVKSATRHDSYRVSCVVEGYPAEYPTLTSEAGVPIASQFTTQHSKYKLESAVIIPQAEDEGYICSVETHYKGQPVGRVQKELIVPIYGECFRLAKTQTISQGCL